MTTVDRQAQADQHHRVDVLDSSSDTTRPVYLDYNATSPVAPQVLAAMMPYFSRQYGNASSHHAYGFESHQALDLGRHRVAHLLGCRDDEIVFTGGGSESNNLAIKGVVLRDLSSAVHLITSVIDHPAVQNTCAYLSRRFRCRVTTLSVDRHGMVDPEAVVDALEPDTRLISIMLANNEVGTIQPIGEIAGMARERSSDVVIHTDAAQAVGKIPVDVDDLGVDLLSVAGHKFCGPKGVGALFVRHGIELDPVIHGSGHERGCRAGTENVPGIVGLGMAAQLASDTMAPEESRLSQLRDRLERGVCEAVPGARVHGHPTLRLPNTLNVSFAGASGNAILQAAPGIAASTGSACHSGATEPSSVLLSMGVPAEIAAGAIRLSIGRFTTEEQIDVAVQELALAAQLLAE